MALWGNNDAVGSAGTVSLNYTTRVCLFNHSYPANVGSAATGNVIRFGDRAGTYYGDAVIASIASTQSLTIASTMGLSGAAIAGTSFTVSELPIFTVSDSHYSEVNGDYDSYVYGAAGAGVTAAHNTTYDLTHAGWVGVTTYNDSEGNLRVKSETLVAMSGITTGNTPAFPPV